MVFFILTVIALVAVVAYCEYTDHVIDRQFIKEFMERAKQDEES